MELHGTAPYLILDGAHNPDKIKTTVAAIETLTRNKEANVASLHLVLAFSENKNIPAMIRLLTKLNPKTIRCTRNTVNYFRKVALPKDIAAICRRYMKESKIEIYMDPKDALDAAQKQAKKNDIILATGSLFMSGELRAYLTG